MAISWLLYTNLQNKTHCRWVNSFARSQKRQHKYIVYLAVAIFWTIFAKKGSYFQSKTNKIDTNHCILHIGISLFQISPWTNNFKVLHRICPRKTFIVKKKKIEHHHWIPLIRISLGTKFRLKLKMLIFLTRFTQKELFWSKTEKWTAHIFYIILYVQISLGRNFSSNWQFWFIGPNLPKKLFPVENNKSEHLHEILHIRISLGNKFQF